MSTKKKTLRKTKARQLPYWEDGIQVGSPPKVLKNESPFSYGDEVMCLKEIDCSRRIQEYSGCWNSKIAKFTGKTGIVCGMTSQGDVQVCFSGNIIWTFHPGALTKTLGQIGKVMQVHKDGDFPGQFQDESSIFNPACLTSCESNQDENFMTPDISTESKSLGKPAESPTEKSVRRALFQPEDDCGNSTVEMASQLFSQAQLEAHQVLRQPDLAHVDWEVDWEANSTPGSCYRESPVSWVHQTDNGRTCSVSTQRTPILYQLVPDQLYELLWNLSSLSGALTCPSIVELPMGLLISLEVAYLKCWFWSAKLEEESPDTASTGEWHTDSPELPEKPVVEEKTSPVSKTENNRLLEEFEDIKEIGSGGCGTVFKATHHLDRKVYAIKCVTDDKEGKREVQAMVKLNHKYIVRYYTCWMGKHIDESEDSSNNSSVEEVYTHDHWFIQMEFCEKGTLECWIDQKNDMEIHEDDVFLKFQQIIEGVAYIHSQNIIHRDLKPSNIFISSQDIIKIGDFGLAASGVDDLSVKRTKSTGTRTYMAPEQMETTYGKEVDIFPLGLIWFEMLYRFRSRHERSQKWENVRGCKFPPEFVKQFPAEASVIKQLLSEEPSKRMSIDVLLEFLNRDESNHQESLAKSVKNQSEAWTGRSLLS